MGITADGSSKALAGTPVKTSAAASPRRRHARLLLLLHSAWVATLLLLVAGSLGSRRRRHLDLARQLLAVHEAQVLQGGAAPAGGGATFAQCGEALQLPQVMLDELGSALYRPAFCRRRRRTAG